MWICVLCVVSPCAGRDDDDDDDGAREAHRRRRRRGRAAHGTGGAFGPRSAYVRPRRPLLGSRRGACVCVHPSRPGRGDPRDGERRRRADGDATVRRSGNP